MYYYENEIFENYQAFAAKHPDAAAELLNKFSEGKWQDSKLCWYPSEEDFAVYEIEDGWYSSIPWTADFNGAPNLLDVLDFVALGRALAENWDDSCNFEANNGEISIY